MVGKYQTVMRLPGERYPTTSVEASGKHSERRAQALTGFRASQRQRIVPVSALSPISAWPLRNVSNPGDPLIPSRTDSSVCRDASVFHVQTGF